jgi:hypothetical protein
MLYVSQMDEIADIVVGVVTAASSGRGKIADTVVGK